MGGFCYFMGQKGGFGGIFDPKILKSTINLLNRGVKRFIRLDIDWKQIL